MAPPRVNEVVQDPDFGSRIVRVTDKKGIDGQLAGFGFYSDASGEANEWGKFNPALGQHGGYFFFVGTSGGGIVPFMMDASTMQVRPVCKSLPSCRLGAEGTFSFVNPNILFGHFGRLADKIKSYNIATGEMQNVYDFRRCPNIPQAVAGFPGAVNNSGDDTKFSDYSGGRIQDFGTRVSFYDRSSDRCFWLDTATGTTGGTGMATTPVDAGIQLPPAAPQLNVTQGELPPADYYVELTASTSMNPKPGETNPSPEVHIRLQSPGGIEISPPAIENPYGLAPAGYSVYIGTAPGREMRQAKRLGRKHNYVQSSPLAQGPPPPTVNTAGYNVHNARLSKHGTVIKIVPSQGGSSYFWKPGTTHISACGFAEKDEGRFCGGHSVLGYNHMINHDGPGSDTSLLLRPLSNLGQTSQLISADPAPVRADMDTHWSWNDADPGDTMPVCGAFSGGYQSKGNGSLDPAVNPLLKIRQAWDREIVCVATSGPPRVWRFAHHRASTACNSNDRDSSCFGSIAIGNVSQDGKFYLFSSDWEWSLGGMGSGGCPKSGGCRSDVFVVELK